MSTITAEKIDTISACFGSYPQTHALKSGQIGSDRVALELVEIKPVYKAFGMMVREQKFDVRAGPGNLHRTLSGVSA